MRQGQQSAGSGAWQFARQLVGTFPCSGAASPIAFAGAEIGPLQAVANRGTASLAWGIKAPELNGYLNNSVFL